MDIEGQSVCFSCHPSQTTNNLGATSRGECHSVFGFWKDELSGMSMPCQPEGSCAGENQCLAGYMGERCGLCEDGYFKQNGGCSECPVVDNDLVQVVYVFGIGYVCTATIDMDPMHHALAKPCCNMSCHVSLCWCPNEFGLFMVLQVCLVLHSFFCGLRNRWRGPWRRPPPGVTCLKSWL